MRAADVARLIALAAIWGASFLFMRVVASNLAPPATAALRLAIGGGALALYLMALRTPLQGRAHWRGYLAIGMVNSGIPFLLFAIAALSLPAAYLSVLNATAPLFGAVAAAIGLGTRIGRAQAGGLALGIAGVALVARAGPIELTPAVLVGIGAALAAALSYGIASVVIKRLAVQTPPPVMAAMSQVAAALAIAPLVALAPPPGPITPTVVGAMLGLGLACSGIAYLLFFRLIADIGPSRALTVTFLIPVFGMLWAALFLGEAITLGMIVGAGLVVGGTALVLRPVAT